MPKPKSVPVRHRRTRIAASSAVALAVAGLAAGGAGAQTAPGTDPAEPIAIQPVVVSASAIEQTLANAPASIGVVTREDLERTPVRDLTDVLGRVEGVTLRRAGNQRTVQIRGLESAYTLMLIDGRRVSSTSAVFRGNDYDTGWIPTEAIERVEVVRGPMSSLYGSDAIGGVVNIITRPVAKTWSAAVSGDMVIQENRDAGDSYRAGFFMSGPIVPDRLGLKVYGGYDLREADKGVNPPLATSGAPLAGFATSRNRTVSSALSWTPDTRNTVEATYDYSKRDHGGFQLDRQAAMLSHKGKWSFGNTEIRAYGDEIENRTGNVTGQKNPNTATNLTADGKVSVPVDWLSATFTLGGESRLQKLKDPSTLTGLPGTPAYRTDDTTEVTQHAAFLEGEFWLTDSLMLTLGDRLDYHENFGSHNSPRAYLVYHLAPGLSIKGGLAKAFRAPTLLQNSPSWGSVSCGSATVGCYIIGSEELEPETSFSKEVGVRYDLGRWGAGVTAWHNDVKNMIDITSRTSNRDLAPSYPNFVGFLPDGRPIFRYQNINKVRTQGIEATFRADLTDTLKLRGNYTYTHARNLSGAIDLPLVYTPEHSFNATLDWAATERLKLSLTASYVGQQYILVPSSGVGKVTEDGYVTFDLVAAYALTDGVTLRAGVLNVADKTVDRRESSNEFNEEGRRYFVALSAKF